MLRRLPAVTSLPVIAAMVLTLASCADNANGETADVQTAAAQAQESDAADPVVLRIGDENFDTIMAIHRRYVDAKGGPIALGAPLAPAEDIDGGTTQEYTSGVVYWSPETGAHIVRGQILDTYLENGGPTGNLGWPTSDETTTNAMIYSDFQNGRITLEDQTLQLVRYS